MPGSRGAADEACAQELALLSRLPSLEARVLSTYQLGTLQYAADLPGAEATCKASLRLCQQLGSPDPEQVLAAAQIAGSRSAHGHS